MCFGVVERNSIVGHVDALTHRAAHTQTRVTEAVTSIRGSHNVGECRKKERNVLTKIHLFNRFLVQIGESKRSFLGSAIAYYLGFTQISHARGVSLLC